MEQYSFGYWLKLRRKALDLTREGLAGRVGYSAETIRKIETEQRRPSTEMAERLAEILDIPQDERPAFLRFARGDWHSGPVETRDDVPWQASVKSPRSNLPKTVTSLIGRGREIAEIRDYLLKAEIHLVTLIGPPGIGKTRLSIEVGRAALADFSDGVFFVAMATLEDPSLIALTMVQALGYVETKNVPARQQLIDGIGGKQMLIMLDNCEHLVDDIASLSSELLSACSRLKILATSRESIRVPGEWLYPVPMLGLPKESSSIDVETAAKFPALVLFAERARAVDPDFALHAENIQAIASICSQLDGLPLAIELIAARVRLMSPEALLIRLNDQFVLYADGMRALPARQKTLRNAIDWSYSLLSAEEQDLFARLSIFSGGFTLEAAESIFSRTVTDKSIPDLIAWLLDKSLLQRSLNKAGEPRFHMLVTIQQFALNHLRRRNEEAEVRNWHFDHFLDLAEKADKEIHGPKSLEWLDRLESDHDNYRAALDWCIANGYTESALHLIGIFSGVGRLWSVRNYFTESRQWFEKARALPDVSQHPLAYATALNGMSFITALQGDYSTALSKAEESQRICQSLGSEGEMALGGALFAIGLTEFWRQGNLDRSKSCYEQAAVIYQAHGNDWERAFASFRLGVLASGVGNYERAQRILENSLVTFEAIQDTYMLGRAYAELGFMYDLRGDYERARMVLEQALVHDRRLRFPHAIRTTLIGLSSTCRMQNDYDQAEAYLGEALTISREFSLSDMRCLFYSGCIMLHQENYSLAGKHFYDSLKNSLKIDANVDIGESLFGLAAVAAGFKEYKRAALLTGAGQVVHDTVSYKMPHHDRVEINLLLQIARRQFGGAKFEALAAEGRAMTLEQVIEYAHELATG